MNKIKLYIAIIIISFLGFIFGAFKVFNIVQPDPFKSSEIQNDIQNSEIVTNKQGRTAINILFGNKDLADIKEYPVELNENTSAFDALKLTASENSIELKSKQYDFGVFIESIGNFPNTKDKSWIYFVNGNSADVSADKYILKGGDVVEWKYIKPSF